MSLPNPFFCPPLPWYSSCLLQLSFHFSFTRQQLNPDSDSSHVHINFLLSILQHPTTPPPHPIQIGTQVAMATISGSADVRNSSKDSHAGIGSGDMQRCWASRNKMAATPPPTSVFFSFSSFFVLKCVIWMMWDILCVIGVRERHHRAELSEPLRDRLPVWRI